MTTFDIDSLRAIVAGADLGSFARAATQMGRSQSAISMQLRKLEQQAGAPLFARKGRGLVPTEAGEKLIAYARRIIALNDEAAAAMGTVAQAPRLRLGLPQDFFADVLPASLETLSHEHPLAHVDVRVGDNHKLPDEVRAGRLDGAIVFALEGDGSGGEVLLGLPMQWLAHEEYSGSRQAGTIDLVMFDNPCVFRLATLAACDAHRRRWQMAMTTPSLHYVWSALQSKLGVGVRIAHALPDGIVPVGEKLELPELPQVELRLHRAINLSDPASALCEALRTHTINAFESG